MTTQSNQKSNTPLAGSYASNFQIALTNWYLLQIDQTKRRKRRDKSEHEFSTTQV